MEVSMDLREALERYDRGFGVYDEVTPTLEIVIAAARSWLNLLDDDNVEFAAKEKLGWPPPGSRVWWCATHSAQAVPRLGMKPFTCWKAEFTRHLSTETCNVSPAGLVVPLAVEGGTDGR